jgi:hypothetical protein
MRLRTGIKARLSVCYHNCKSSSLLVDRKYQNGQSRDNYIILSFNSKYKLQWINVIFLTIAG